MAKTQQLLIVAEVMDLGNILAQNLIHRIVRLLFIQVQESVKSQLLMAIE